MSARIRLQRKGRAKFPKFRIVVTSRSDGSSAAPIEILGNYFPEDDHVEKEDEVDIDEDRVIHWLESGATPSDTVHDLFSSIGLLERFEEHKQEASAS